MLRVGYSCSNKLLGSCVAGGTAGQDTNCRALGICLGPWAQGADHQLQEAGPPNKEFCGPKQEGLNRRVWGSRRENHFQMPSGMLSGGGGFELVLVRVLFDLDLSGT